MTRLMSNIYNFRLQDILEKTTSSIRQFAGNGLVQLKYCVLATLFFYAGAYNAAQADTWDGTYSTSWSAAGITGAGTAANPYVIDSAHKFATLGYLVQTNANNANNKYFRLDADIDLDGANREWTYGEAGATNFKGNLDGNGHTISNMKIVARSSQETGNYNGRYGLFCALQGSNVNQRASIKNLILANAELVIESASTTGERNGERYYGLLAGKLHGYCYVENIKVTDPKITIKCNQQTRWDVGTIGSIPGASYAKNILVTNPKFKSEGTGLTFVTNQNSNNYRFSVGGVVGYLSDDNRGTDVYTANDGTKLLRANYITDCAVVNADFNFQGFVPSVTNNLRYNMFSIGGVVGCHWYPIRMCENLFFSGKIKAQYAYIVPCVYVGMNANIWDKIVDNYDGEQMNDADRVEKSRSATWYYGDYKIGINTDLFTSSAITNGYLNTENTTDCRYLNFQSGAVSDGYVDVTQLRRSNRNNSTARPSKTLLWWTSSHYCATSPNGVTEAERSKAPSDYADWTDGYQNIYPQTNQEMGAKYLTAYPDYYMYHAQGVNMHTKHMNSSAAKSFVAGLKGNIETAMGTASKKVSLTIGERVAGEDIDEAKRPAVRGYVDHNFTVSKGDYAGDLTYKWYVDGVENTSGESLSSVKPNFVFNQGWQSGKGITVVAFGDASDTLAVATTYIPIYRLRVKDQESCTTKVDAGFRTYTYDLGTQSHPYLIGSENDLRLMQEQMLYEANTSNEHIYLTGINNGNRMNLRSQMSNATTSNSPSYQQSYYEMDGNVTMSSTQFFPIGPNCAQVYSNDGSSGSYRESAAFVGDFDGKGYTISGVRQEWHSGYSAASIYNLWGLFGQISRENRYIKTGDTSASNAVVRNLIIDDIQLTHRTSNTSFCYNNGAAFYDGNTLRAAGSNNWANNCYIGTLAALVGANATIENIAVTNAKITDEGTASAYTLGSRQFFVGGLIGVLRKQLTNDNGSLANTVIRYVSSDADINLQYPKFWNAGNAWEQLNYLVGGLIGRMYSNAADNTLPYPKPSIFTGKIRSYVYSADAANQRAGAMAGPIFAYSAYSGNNGTGWADFPKHFLGKTTNTAAFDATNMFYNYQHYHSDGTYHDITDTYPPVTTDWGDRNMKQVATHVSSNVYTGTGTGTTDYDLLEYQGVNQGIYASEQDPTVTSAFNDISGLTEEEQENLENYKWTWSRNTASRPIVTIGEVSGLYVTAKDTYNGDDVTSHIIEATVNSASTGERTYQWYKKMRMETSPGVWKNDTIAIDGATSATYTATPSVHNQYIMVRATINGESAYSEPVIVPKNQNIVATISKEAGESPVKWVMKATVATDYATPMDSTALKNEKFVISYQWYKGMVGSGTKLTGETHDYLNVTDDETYIRYCIITVADSTAHSDYRAANSYTFTVSMLPANTMVVYLNPSGISSVNEGAAGSDSNDGLSPATAVKSWHKAYSLLRDNVTWDDNIIVLMSASDRGRTSEGFYSDNSTAARSWSSWYTIYHDNATMLRTESINQTRINEPASFTMSDYTPGYDGWTNADLWKNVTITGRLDADHDYSSTGSNTAVIYTPGGSDDNMMILGDTRFKNLTFYGGSGGTGGHNYDILYCYYNNLEMGDSLVFVNQAYANRGGGAHLGLVDNAWGGDFHIFGGPCNDGRFKETSESGFDNALMEAHLPHGKEGFSITIKSGFYSAICSTYRQNSNGGAGIIGTPNMPVKCAINIDIDTEWNKAHDKIFSIDGNGTAGSGSTNGDASYPSARMTYDVGLVMAGNHEGAMYGDVDLNFYSGRVSRVAAGNLGAIRDLFKKDNTYYIPLNNYMGRARTLFDPANSRLAETDGKTDAERLIVTEVYGGSLGRSHNSDGMINVPFLGHSSVTVNGGTFKLLQKDNTVTADAQPGIYATGAGGVNGIYHVAEDRTSTATQRLPYWKNAEADKTIAANNVVLYGDWSTYNANRGNQHVSVKCYNADTDDYTVIDLEDTKTEVTINGGIFGSETAPLKGIYGGGSGYTPQNVLVNGSSYLNYRAGNIYSKKDADHPAASLTINGGEFYCPIYGGGRGTEYYYQTARSNSGSSGNGAWYGNYTALGQIYGDVALTITGGTFHDNVFGAGKGFGTIRYNSNSDTKQTLKDMARIYGTTTVNITGGTFEGNVYGGGAIANVGYGTTDNTRMTPEIAHYGTTSKNAVTMNISGARISGNVFASAQGLYLGETIGSRVSNVDKYTTFETLIPDSVGNVYGNVILTIQGDTIGGDIYGGAEKGDVYGNVTASISNSGIAGDIYGGGMGVLSGETVTASADIKGSTMITLGKGTSYVTLSDGKYVADYSTAHYLYGGGNLASVIGTYTGTPVSAVVSGGNTTVNVNNGMGTGQLSVFGAGYGANTYCNMTNVNINSFDKTKTVNSVTKNIGLKVVYGGGNEGTVYTNTNVNMNGGQVFGHVFGGGNLAPVGTLSAGTYPYEPYGTMVSMANKEAYIWGDIYGGGNKADVSGVAQVSVTRGSFAGQVFGGGRGEMTDDNTVGTAANINGQTRVLVDGAYVKWDTKWDNDEFVEWNGRFAAGNYDTNFFTWDDENDVPVFIDRHNIFGGGYLACAVTDTARVEVTNGAVPAALISEEVWKQTFEDNNNPHFYVFGGGYGPFTSAKNTDVTVGVEGYYSDEEDESTNEQWSLDIPIEGMSEATAVDAGGGGLPIFGNNYGIGGYTVLGVIGGGYAGLVQYDTNVKLGGTTFVHRVYGGGYGHRGEFDKLSVGTDIKTGGIATTKTRANLGEVGRNTRVLVSLSAPDENGRTGGVYGDVFGGGAGVESYKYDGSTYTDFPDMGKVLGFTRVNLVENARVYGNVYGGGDVANVTNTNSSDSTTIVRLTGGDVFGSVFAGGKGRISAKANTYSDLGNINGNTFVIVRDSVGTDDEGAEYTISPNIWGSIYGGGQVGDVKSGNANVLIDGGNIGSNIYGAGMGDITSGTQSAADVEGNTNVSVNGGSYLWRQRFDESGSVLEMTDAEIVKETAVEILNARKSGEASAELQALSTNYSSVFDYSSNLFKDDHNIYGGGYMVSTVTGNANVTVNHGMVTEEMGYYNDDTWTLGALLYQLVTGNNSHPQFSVLGGGYGINTTISGNTNVNVQVGTSTAYTGQTTDQATWDAIFNGSTGTYKTEFDALSEADQNTYYGGTSGANSLARYVTSRLANRFSIPNHSFMNVVGGGMAGKVRGNAVVNISDQTMCQNVFGGGIGWTPTAPVGEEDYGQVGGTATVTITGGIVKGNVYGGGAGVESYKNGGTYIDFPEIGAVDKTTSVTIDGTPTGTIVFGKVFGGGDVANVKNSASATYGSQVTIQGGCIYQQIFAGGSGVLESESNDYTTLGKVTGDVAVTVTQDTNTPWIWNRIYGGGSYGTVTGNTTVNIQGGHIGYNIFGGGLGDVRTLDNGTESVTTSTVGGNTNVNITGGEWCLSQMWDLVNLNWVPKTNNSYSAQYDLTTNKFLINHNIYGGGNAASTVTGNTNITMTKGLLHEYTPLGYDDNAETGRHNSSLFASNEWKNIYNKVGSFHFCVIGGGYGSNTTVTGNTNVNINMTGDATIAASDSESKTDVVKTDLSGAFKSLQSVMDVVGGGYNGAVNGETNVTIQGDSYLRRAFGGSFYADVAKTNINIVSANVDDVFGGCMMGDVTSTDNTDLAQAVNLTIGSDGAATNSKIFVNHDVYGGNDVSGQVNGRIKVDIKGGKIYNNVYGAGNGNYLYILNEERSRVVAVEDSVIDGETFPLIYEVPRRTSLMPASASSASEASKLVNINSYRPLSQYINLSVVGASSSPVMSGKSLINPASATTARVKVLGDIYGGGNTATVTMLDGNDPQVTVNLGDYIEADRVFMGSDGEAMFEEGNEGETGYLNAFKRINDINLHNGINWVNDPYNKAIPETYLPLSQEERVKAFPHIVDLYFQPVQMSVQPTLKWNGVVATPNADRSWTGGRDVESTTFNSFFCGGNRGNMDVTPANDGRVVNYIFPAGLTIKNKLVGGCNNANFIRDDLNVSHEGGYLLGSTGTEKPMIYMLVKCAFQPADSTTYYAGGNVYGGCYESGTIRGDIHIDVHSNMVNGLDAEKLQVSNDDNSFVSAGNVFGGGYGADSFVYGNIEVALGTSDVASSQSNSLDLSFEDKGNSQQSLNLPFGGAEVTETVISDAGFSANNVFGGGEKGSVIGNTVVKILNGHVNNNVAGGTFSGIQYGSTHVLVGYPSYYTANESGIYLLNRADKKNTALRNYGGTKVVKDTIRLIQGDIIAPAIRDSIVAHTPGNASKFDAGAVTAPADWSKVSIKIGEAVYGGGYAQAHNFSSTGGAGSYTVRRYTTTYNSNNSMSSTDPLYNVSTAGYGGNTTVLVWEDPTLTAEHVTISSAAASSEGGLYGDGHLSYAEGFRAGELKGYGYAQHSVSKSGEVRDTTYAKYLNSIQHFDVVRLTDNCVVLNGARDYTNRDVSSTPYSLARIGELQMVSSLSKTGTLPTDSTTVKSRNYLGLINNIHYVGAISSNHYFTDDYHNAKGVISSGTSYLAKKKKYIDDFYGAYSAGEKTDISAWESSAQEAFNAAKSTFNMRNDATAINLIGISSGYAFKVQNVRTTDANGTEALYYGPIVGVAQMKLIAPIAEEGGGYVYADNVHDAPSYFLESTGNFVFPAGVGGGRYVVDDCLLTHFDDMEGTPQQTSGGSAGTRDAEGTSEIHYWFLTGNHYQYWLHITGYTYDSASEPINFDADTSDGLVLLPGAEASGANALKITSVTWLHDGKNWAPTSTTGKYNDDMLNAKKHYGLHISASNDESNTYNEAGLYGKITRGANTSADPVLLNTSGITEFTSSPKLAIVLRDSVNNSAGNSEGLSATEYYDTHLARPDTVVIVLASGTGYEKTYTINLVINYVKGPSYTGHISVANCALPGEYIRLSKADLTISADAQFAQNGEYWRIGKRTYDEGTSTYSLVAPGYYTYDASGEKTDSVLFCNVHRGDDYILIPAYYFMDGYGVQYVFTCTNMSTNGMPTEFPVTIQAADTLVVHNYHQMKPRATFDTDLRLMEAVTRAYKESTFPEPRIYIQDAQDLNAFREFVDTVGVNTPKITLSGYLDKDDSSKLDSINVPTAGQYAQFFLQNDVTVQQSVTSNTATYYKAGGATSFAGTFHGDGHTITGIEEGTPLVATLAATGNVHNLGLASGKIATTVNDGGKIRTSYEYEALKAYRMDGTADTYTEEDFRYGKVAYNLNEYYLAARKYLLDNSITVSAPSADNVKTLANQTAAAYLKNYYLNGDYQYARQYNATTGKEYLRTQAHPHYYTDVSTDFDGYTSYHKTTHDIDVARAVDKDEQGDYRPLFNVAKVHAASDADVVKNDYIFFGQGLQAEPEEHPVTIASHDVSDMTNRVYRASGFYRSQTDEGFHFNADMTRYLSTYVHDAHTTAIDFTGQRDYENSGTTAGWRDVTTAEKKQHVFYAPSLDLPVSTTSYHDFVVDAGVTKNLLAYTDGSSTSNTIAKVVSDRLGYTAETSEGSIKGHVVTGSNSATPATSYTAARLHLVDMEDFNAPISFTATDAWYDRAPGSETGFVEQAGKAWASVCLPYTVETATLSEGIERAKDAFNNGQVGTQTSITYFYGDGDTKALNPNILNHEFWLRRLTAVNESTAKATFKRPTYQIGNTQGFAAYKPFIVSFPGNQFYEFDMTGQTITFGADDALIKVTDVAVADSATTASSYYHYGAFLNNDGETGAYAINVNGEGDKFENGQTIYPFRSYLTKETSPLGGNSMNLSFNEQSSMVNADYILIADDLAKLEEILDGDIERDPDGGVTTQSGLRVYGVGKRIVVVSDYATTLPVYTSTGALVRVLDVRPGTATYSGFAQGIYIVDQKKIRLR